MHSPCLQLVAYHVNSSLSLASSFIDAKCGTVRFLLDYAICWNHNTLFDWSLHLKHVSSYVSRPIVRHMMPPPHRRHAFESVAKQRTSRNGTNQSSSRRTEFYSFCDYQPTDDPRVVSRTLMYTRHLTLGGKKYWVLCREGTYTKCLTFPRNLDGTTLRFDGPHS